MTDEQVLKPERNEDGLWVCPECGEPFKLAIQLGSHRRFKHNVQGSSEKHKTAAKKSGTGKREEARKTRVSRTLRELADLADELRGRSGGDLPEHLADVIRRDADALATVITKAAEQLSPVKFLTDTVFPVLGTAVGASGVLRWLLRAARRRAEQQYAEEPDEGLIEYEHGDLAA